MAELKPCPFCGVEHRPFGGILQFGSDGKKWMHTRNGCILGGFLICEEDIDAWNKRAGDSE